MWTRIQKVIPQKAKTLGMESELVFLELKRDWDGIVAETIEKGFCGKSKPLRVKNKVLMVDCLNSIWASEFRIRSQKITEKVRSIKKYRALVDEIKFIN